MSSPAAAISSAPPVDAAPGACLLCARNEGTTVWRENGYDVRHCAQCGVLYLDPAPPPGHVDFTREQHDDSYYARPARVRANWVQTVRPNGRLLEVGCGGGHFLAECRRRGYEVFGCEPDAERARFCRAQLQLDVETAYIEDTALPPGSFDVVFHVDLLSHFPDPVGALRTMARLLRPGGVLCFEVGTMAGVAQRYIRWNGGLGVPDHRWFFSLDGIRSVIDRAGLQIESLKQFGLVPAMLPLVLGRTLVKPLVQWRRGKEARPWDGAVESDAPLRKVRGIYRLGQRVEFELRYHLGPYVPKVGPTTLFVAASPKAQ
ncbi:MAG: class I SAM-dependent methyltransferase [Pirellulales bacterium]